MDGLLDHAPWHNDQVVAVGWGRSYPVARVAALYRVQDYDFLINGGEIDEPTPEFIDDLCMGINLGD